MSTNHRPRPRVLPRRSRRLLLLGAMLAGAGCDAAAEDCERNPNLPCFGAGSAGTGATSATTTTGAGGGAGQGGSGGSGSSGSGGGEGGAAGSTSTGEPTRCTPEQLAAGDALDASCGVFVVSGGRGNGTREAPFGTLAEAQASVEGAQAIYVCRGDAPLVEAVVVDGSVDLFGGVDCATGTFLDLTASANRSTWTAPADAIPLQVIGGEVTVHLRGLALTAAAGEAPGASSIALLVHEATLEILDTSLQAGAASPGAPGAVVVAAPAAAPGTVGGAACVATTSNGGNPGENTCVEDVGGGSGGPGALPLGANGDPGRPIAEGIDGGVRATSGAPCMPGEGGGVGSFGPPAQNPANASRGRLGPLGFEGTGGAAGGAGTRGSGGGGGGAGYCSVALAGAGGGGGGAGGCGGLGGPGGAAGGSSFALASIDASVSIDRSTLRAGSGGKGGDGAPGQPGQPGGLPGQPGAAGGSVQAGCPGGAGGAGGQGGSGSGGDGGHSVAIAFVGGEPARTDAVELQRVGAGPRGLGGQGTALANRGDDGRAGLSEDRLQLDPID